MSTINESLIELYVGFPETLDALTWAAVNKLVNTDQSAQAIADFYRGYYDELHAVMTYRSVAAKNGERGQ